MCLLSIKVPIQKKSVYLSYAPRSLENLPEAKVDRNER